MALLDVVDEHSRFFNHLADLVDPRYFHEDSREPVNLRYMKKEARMSTKRAFKEQHKKNKRAKLDPDAAKTTTEVQRQKIQRGSEDEMEDDTPGPPAAAHSIGRLHINSGKQELYLCLWQNLISFNSQMILGTLIVNMCSSTASEIVHVTPTSKLPFETSIGMT